jgi:hypothetical protein
LYARRENFEPLILVRAEAIIAISLRIYFLSVLAKATEGHPHALRAVLYSNFYNCAAVPYSAKCIDVVSDVEIHAPLVVGSACAKFIEEGELAIGGGAVAVVMLDHILFWFFFKEGASCPSAIGCRGYIGSDHIASFADCGFIPFQGSTLPEGVFEGGILIVVFVVFAGAVID